MIAALILIALAATAEAIMDILQFHFETSAFWNLNKHYWNPQWSWMNKYKDLTPSKGPAFFGSTSFLVAITDAWHLLKMFRTLFLFIGIGLIGYSSESWWSFILWLVLGRVIFGLVFTVMFNKVFAK